MEQRDDQMVQNMEDTINTQHGDRIEGWPALPYEAWRDTCQTLHLWTQIVGKSSPVHFFWGSFDLAVTLFPGRRAPERPGAERMTREAYSHEVISCGFWPGNDGFPTPAFYAYTSPEPPGLSTAAIRPQEAFYSRELGEFLLRYEEVRNAPSPEQALLAFFQSTYEAGATLGKWEREVLARRAR